ncbi:MAG: glycerol-3-phosphate 1-O-acyltransferase PlsY [Oscillospiraceae bacterium]|nr:glycerol-3-phosphate 1-O-acyltransferase PlsY [Oscillospiraceae bacterium]MBR2927624.1 glycerol-3-phosphate 1-O-acyltransferase PlsY [Oscillospiraceae bacterium]MBR6677219.1 glycerol-3-phosphate 1-O-acyltransferase PlsY [Oscillospiraceae bacterium]
MPVSVTDWLLYFCVCMLSPGVIAYLCGNINGAILISKYIFHEDVRTKGSGNAGLTNFYRNYGGKYAALVIALDALKMVAAVVVACLFMGWTIEAKLWGGLCCALGHMFPAVYQFKGGKGILSCGTLLLMLDWRVALVAWGTFLLLAVLTRYVSLGSVMCALTTPVTVALCYPGHWVALALMTVTAALVVWAHRGNISRLCKGTESKFTFKKE